MTTGDSLRLGWWNTKLAPAGKLGKDHETRAPKVREIVRTLVDDQDLTLLALGEVGPRDAHDCFASYSGRAATFKVHSPKVGRIGRATAMAVAYDPARLTLLEETMLSAAVGGDVFQTAWRLTLATHAAANALEVVLVHWPSHLQEDWGARRRQQCATSLRDSCAHFRDVVVLGDFNDEPFSAPLSEGLLAYRDRDLVRRKKRVYYNPFWRLLGEQQHLEHEGRGRIPVGTFFRSNGQSSQWFTYDQALVSSALIEPNAWQLVEAETQIIYCRQLISGGKMVDGFDHLPIVASLIYNEDRLHG